METMKKAVEDAIKDKILPLLKEHGGGVRIISLEDNILTVKLQGACLECPHMSSTFEDVVKRIIFEEVPEVEEVILDRGVSEDLLDMARKILRGDS